MWKISLYVLLVSIILLSYGQTDQIVVAEDCEGKGFLALHDGLFCDHENSKFLYLECEYGFPSVRMLSECDRSEIESIDPVLIPGCDFLPFKVYCTDEVNIKEGMCYLRNHDQDCELKYEYGTRMMEWSKIFSNTIIFQYNDLVVSIIENEDGSYSFSAVITKPDCESEDGGDEKFTFFCKGYTSIIYNYHKIVHTDIDGNTVYEELTRKICSDEDGSNIITINYKEYFLEIEFEKPNCLGEVKSVRHVKYEDKDEWTYPTNAYSFKSGSLLLKYYISSECDDNKSRKSLVYLNKDVCSLNENRPEYDIRYVDEKHYKLIDCGSKKEEIYEFDKCYKRLDGVGHFKVENLMISPVIEESKCDDLDVHCHIDGEVHLEDKIQVKYMHVTLGEESKVYLYPTPNSTIVSDKEGHVIIENSKLIMSMDKEKYYMMMDMLEEEEEVSMTVIEGSYEGSFSELSIEMDDDIDECKSMKDEMRIDDNSITIAFKMDDSNCKFPSWAIVLITIGIAVVLSTIAISVVIFYKPLRLKLLPYRRKQ